MDNALHAPARMVEAARAGLPSNEAEALRALGAEGFPAGRSGPRAVQASHELGAHPRLCQIRGVARRTRPRERKPAGGPRGHR
eukprot:12919736-Alexandrium_andersonii.AAC.1